MLSVNTNTAALTAQRNLSTNSDMASNSIARMSSGTRIVKPSDDASSLAISNKLRADIAALEQAGRNASQGASLLQVANGAYDRIGDMLSRMKVLATQVINGTLGTNERLFAQEEFTNLRTQITNTATQTRFGSVNLLSGGGGQYAGGGALAALGGTGNTSNLSSVDAGMDGLITSGAAQNNYFNDTSFAHTGANASTAVVNSGFVNGAVSDINVTIAGQAFQVSMKVGNQTFVGRIDSTTQTAGDRITLSSTSNSANSIQMAVANATGTSYTEAVRARVETGLRTLLSGTSYTAVNIQGIDTANATDNGLQIASATFGITQNGATVPIVAGAGTEAGTYSFQYVSTGAETATGASGYANGTDDRRGTGFFVLTNGANTWTVDQEDVQIVGNEGTAGAYGTVTFGNGLQVYLSMAAGPTTNAGTSNPVFDRGNSSTNTFRFEIGTGGGVDLAFQVSDSAQDQASINFSSATASALGLEGLSIADTTSAATASARIDIAINVVNTAQAGIGALQSRFEYIQSTISTTVENVSAARGTFRDVDMAAEMTSFTRSQTLMQASIAMLSQANQMPQQLLRLLQ
jgi:flagellin